LLLNLGSSNSGFAPRGFTAEAASQEDSPAGLPKEVQAMLDDLQRDVDHRAKFAELMTTAHAFYTAGESSYKNGDRAAAQADFVRARDVILSAEEEVFYEPSVHSYFLQLTRHMAALNGIATWPLAQGSALPTGASERVLEFVKYYQGKGHSVVDTALTRLSRYEGMMRQIFQEEGVPEDLIYVGLVESAYNPYAESPAGAKGIWQFVRRTGNRYGLQQAGGIDDRHHPEKSTRAAARYLQDLYQLFGDWPLALAAYNAGEYRILRIIKKTGLRDFWSISARGLLSAETANYVPGVLAAMTVGRQSLDRKPPRRETMTVSPVNAPRLKRVGKRY
jgi:hypothetical protein